MRTIELSQTPKRQARQAELEIRAIEVVVKPPHARSSLPSVTYNVVLAEEVNGPGDGTDVSWLLITSLPIDSVEAILRVIDYYVARWTIETAFQEMAENLQGEINALGYPKAALFGFCMALASYNVLSVTKAAVSAAHGEEEAETLSTYYVADEIAATYRGMMIVISATYWTKRFARLTATQMARELVGIVQEIDLKRYRKNPWTPKTRTKRKGKLTRRKHVSTARVLQKQNEKSRSHKSAK